MSIKYCPQCGKEANGTMNFCSNCGFDLSAIKSISNEVAAAKSESPPVGLISETPLAFTREELSLFVRKEKYIHKWGLDNPRIVEVQKSWNWSAFFFAFFWMAYRKMYVYSLLTFVALMILPRALYIFVNEDESAFKTAILLINLVLYVGIGNYGNSIYYYFARNKIVNIKVKNPQISGECCR